MDLSASSARQAKKLLSNPRVTKWHDYISKEARTIEREYLLFVPCAKAKPYLPPTRSFFYNWLWKFLKKNDLRDKVFLCTVSEPFALFPETDYARMPDYELSPLVLKGDQLLLESYTATLAEPIANFVSRNAKNHKAVLAYVRPDSTHARFLDRANQLLGQRLVEFAVEMEDLERVRNKHPRMWHLDWMIFLQSILRSSLTRD